ncbi:MAG: RNA polymerase sigma factor [Chloroflexi bacterium]|nr:RNA polymerase sigma factor [Chloroflexota bacterium]
MADGELLAVLDAQSGNRAAFEVLFERHKQQIYNYVLRIMGSSEDAHDLTQDAFLKAYVALPKVKGEMNFVPWLYRIATNVCRDELRRRKIVTWQPLETFTAVFRPQQVAPDDPEGEALRKERAELVQLVLKKLPQKYRLCLVLRECQDLSCEEIGQVLGVSRQAVKSLLFRAREEFRVVYRSVESSTGTVSRDRKVSPRAVRVSL